MDTFSLGTLIQRSTLGTARRSTGIRGLPKAKSLMPSRLVNRFTGNFGSGDAGVQTIKKIYRMGLIKRGGKKKISATKAGTAAEPDDDGYDAGFAAGVAAAAAASAGPSGSPTTALPPAAPAPIRTTHIAAGEEFINKGNTYIVPEGHVFDTRTGRLIADPAASKSKAFVSFANAGVTMQTSFENFKSVTFRKLDTIIDLARKLQLSKPVVAPPPEEPKPEPDGAPEKEKSSSILPFLAGLLSMLGMKYFIRPLIAVFQRIMKWIRGLWTALKKLFMGMVTAIRYVFRQLLRVVRAAKRLFVRVVKFIAGLLPRLAGAITSIGKSIGKFFKDKFLAAKTYMLKKLSAVKNFIAKLIPNSVKWLARMVIKYVSPGARASLVRDMKGGNKLKALLDAEARARAPAAPTVGLDERKRFRKLTDAEKAAWLEKHMAKVAKEGSGARLVRTLAEKIPYVSTLLATAIAVYDIHQADEAFDKSDKSTPALKEAAIKTHNDAVGEAIVGAIGGAIGGAMGGVAGAILGTAFIPIPIIGSIIGGIAGTVIGGFLGEQGLIYLINKHGSVEEFGKFVNKLRPADSNPIVSMQELEKHLRELENTKLSAKDRHSNGVEAWKMAQKLANDKIITTEAHGKLKARIKKLGTSGSTGAPQQQLGGVDQAQEYLATGNYGANALEQAQADRRNAPAFRPPVDMPAGDSLPLVRASAPPVVPAAKSARRASEVEIPPVTPVPVVKQPAPQQPQAKEPPTTNVIVNNTLDFDQENIILQHIASPRYTNQNPLPAY